MKKQSLKILFARYFLNHTTEDENQQVFNSRESEEMLTEQWENFNDIKSEVEAPDTNKMLMGVYRKIAENESASKLWVVQKNKRNTRMQFYRIAAILLVPLFSIAIFLLIRNMPENMFSAEVVKTNQSVERTQFELPDGTKVWLNAESTLKYAEDFSGKTRTVKLDGEAFFEVTKNKERPFIVETSQISVKVLGTKFNVNAYHDNSHFEASVVEGKVGVKSIDAKTESFVLTKNQKAIYFKNDGFFEIKSIDSKRQTAWRKGVLIFDNERFDDIVRKLERWYGLSINLDKKLTEKYRFTLTIRNESVEQVIELLKISTPTLDYRKDNNQIKIFETQELN